MVDSATGASARSNGGERAADRSTDVSARRAANDEATTTDALATSRTGPESIAAQPSTTDTLAGVGSMDAAANAARNAPDAPAGNPAGDPVDDVGSLTDEGIAAVQGTSSLAAREGIGAAAARTGYESTVSGLAPDDVAGRTAAKAQARTATPPVTRAAIESARPDLGPRPGSVGSAARSNPQANALAARLGTVGRLSAATGVVLGGARIAMADDKALETARVAGGALGGIAAGSLVGAQLGALGANPLTIAGGALVGAAIGGIAGEKAVDAAVSWVKGWF